MRRVLSLLAAAALTPSAAFGARAGSPGHEPLGRAAYGIGLYEQYLAPATQCPGGDLPTGTPAAQTGAMLCLIDYARAKHGDPALARSPLLAASAQIKANDIVRCGDFSHTACGHTIEYPFEQAGYITPAYSWSVGENLAHGTNMLGTARSVMLGWLNSDQHRQNIFDDTWRDQNVALIGPTSALGLPNDAVWVSHFGVREAVGRSEDEPEPAGEVASSRIRLRVLARPPRAVAGRRTRFTFRVSAGSQPAVRAFVTFASRRVRTDSAGRARLTVRLPRAGSYRARARKSGYGVGTAVVRALRPA